MKEIYSVKSKLKFYNQFIILTLVFFIIGTIMIISFIIDYNSGQSESITDLKLIICFLLYYLVYYFVKYFKKISPKIIINKDKIIIKDKIYFWKDLQNIKLIDKKRCGFFNYPMQVATLNFNNKEVEFIFDDMYKNSWEIKSFIKQIVLDKKQDFEIEKFTINLKQIEKENFIIFKGNPVFSFRGLMLWLLIFYILFMTIFLEPKISLLEQIKVFVPFCILWFFINAYCMHFFELSKNYFVVKNHYFFWIKKIYKISDIEEIVFESHGRQPNILKIITKDYKSKKYPAGSLRNKTWLKLKNDFEKINIKVNNECI